jgi:hypothetical protein
MTRISASAAASPLAAHLATGLPREARAGSPQQDRGACDALQDRSDSTGVEEGSGESVAGEDLEERWTGW